MEELASILLFSGVIDEKVLDKIDLKLDSGKLNILLVVGIVEENILILQENIKESKILLEESNDNVIELQTSISQDQLLILKLATLKDRMVNMLIDMGKVFQEHDENAAQ